MTTLLREGQAIRSLFKKDIENKATPTDQPKQRLVWAPARPSTSPPTEDSHQNTELADRYFKELRGIDADERLDYLLSVNQQLTEQHLQEVVEATDQWLNHEARDRMRAIALRLAKEQQDPGEVLLNWLTDEEIARIDGLLETKNFPDPILATCYAILEAHGVAHATYFIQQDRLYPQKDLGQIEQSEQEIEEDLRFANAK